MRYEAVRFNNGSVELLDSRKLPLVETYVKCRTPKDIFLAISEMKVRGAPAIGIAGAFGVYLGAARSKAKTVSGLKRDIKKVSDLLASSRPTARNLFWALERMRRVYEMSPAKTADALVKDLLRESIKILDEDRDICRMIGRNGAELIKKGARVLTHCNAGALATGGDGTALGVIFNSRKKIKMVYADETRPLLQGARLTVWELEKRKIRHTLICDNAAASLMARKKVDLVVVGADRIAANGDTANKIGTYGLAVCARHHGIPFYVAAPVSTFDISVKDGSGIPIEERSQEEVRRIGGDLITLPGTPAMNPAFDVTPAGLITAIVTERGIIRNPGKRNIQRMLSLK